MPGNREKSQSVLLKRIKSLTPKSNKNYDLWKQRLEAMTDKEYESFINDLENETDRVTIVSPNLSDDGLTIDNNLAVAESMGHDFWSRLWISNKPGFRDTLTPIKFMVVDLPVRRTSQTSDKKISVPKNNKTIDALTGQVTGESKGAAISAPEAQFLSGMGLEAPLLEAWKYRGGDNRGRVAFNGMLSKYGKTNLKVLSQFQSGVESVNSVSVFLTGAHIKNNLNKSRS